MGAQRVIWHVGFERNLKRRGPRSFEIRAEVPLSDEPPRLDYLLLCKRDVEGPPPDDSTETRERAAKQANARGQHRGERVRAGSMAVVRCSR